MNVVTALVIAWRSTVYTNMVEIGSIWAILRQLWLRRSALCEISLSRVLTIFFNHTKLVWTKLCLDTWSLRLQTFEMDTPLMCFGMSGLVEEMLKYLPIAHARRRGAAEQRKQRDRAYIDYALAGVLRSSPVCRLRDRT